MSKKEVKPPKAVDAKGARPKEVKATKLAEMSMLAHAVEGFIRENSTCESSIPINTALEEMNECSDLLAVFTVALQRQLFGLDAALRWLLFMSQAPGRAVQEGDTPLPATFPVVEALTLIAQVYDIGVQNAVWEHFEDDDESDDEGEEDSRE